MPFVPNIWQWFHVNQAAGRLPAALAGAGDPVDALRRWGPTCFRSSTAAWFANNWPSAGGVVAYEGDPSEAPAWTSFVDFQGGPIRRERVETPQGTLTHVWQYAPQAAAPFEAEHWWKDFEGEYAAVRAWMLDRRFHSGPGRLAARAGQDRRRRRCCSLQLLPTPLKQFHWLAGPAAASLFIADHPRRWHELAAIHQRQALAVVEQVVDLPGVMIFEVPDNLDSTFYSPRLFREFCLPHAPRRRRQ